MLCIQTGTEGWQAAHGRFAAAYGLFLDYGPLLFLLVLAALLLCALAHRRRYRAVGALSPAELEAVHTAVRQAESKTVGEIVVVVLERSQRYLEVAYCAALSTLFCGSAAGLAYLPWYYPLAFLLVQLLLAGLGYGLARNIPGFGRLFLREARATDAAEDQARREFERLALYETEAATGVLIFVSLYERRVVVLADHGIAGRVPADFWKEVDEAVLRGITKSSLSQGLIAGVQRAGSALAEHFPWREGDRNELPDRVLIRAE